MKGKLKNELELDLEAGMLEVYLAEKRRCANRGTEKANGGCMLFAGSEMER